MTDQAKIKRISEMADECSIKGHILMSLASKYELRNRNIYESLSNASNFLIDASCDLNDAAAAMLEGE